jgi:hypothetical protein
MTQTKNTQPPGFKFIGSTGYVFVIQDDGGLIGEHRIVWDEAHGPIPDGFQIHHRNHDRTDNRLENLECVDTVTHKRLHAGHRLVEGVWFKKCTQCGVEQPDSEFPTKKYVEGVRMTRGNCRECERERQRAKNGYVGTRFADGSRGGKLLGPRK